MGSHDPFGHVKHKLWPKEGSGIKLAVWLLTSKSWESIRFDFLVCKWRATYHWKDILLESSWQRLQLCFIKINHVKVGKNGNQCGRKLVETSKPQDINQNWFAFKVFFPRNLGICCYHKTFVIANRPPSCKLEYHLVQHGQLPKFHHKPWALWWNNAF